MKKVLLTLWFSILLSSLLLANVPDWQKHPGDYGKAIKQLDTSLKKNFTQNIYETFKRGRPDRPSLVSHQAAENILALYRMGKISANTDTVKRAYTYMFLSVLSGATHGADKPRQFELLQLYNEIAVPNTNDPSWRIIRARSAKIMWLPEVVELYKQVALDMKGLAPNESIAELWKLNREEFSLSPFVLEEWIKNRERFVIDGKNLDVPGSAPIKGSPFPQLQLGLSVGSDVEKWEHALFGSAKTKAKELDELLALSKKTKGLAWKNGRGFLNSTQCVNDYLLSKPAGDLDILRDYQEAQYKKELLKSKKGKSALNLFRRYPWSRSAQNSLLKQAKQHLFAGEAQAAYRSYEDVLRHTKDSSMQKKAQVGLWLSLSQYADHKRMVNAFTGIAKDSTWPWNGKEVKAETIKKQLLAQQTKKNDAPSLASLIQKVVKLPAVPLNIINVEMQRDGDQLLLSSPQVMAMYAADNPTKPTWLLNRRSWRQIHRYVTKRTGQPQFMGNKLIASWGGDTVADYNLAAFDRRNGRIINSNDANPEQARALNRIIGSPVIADNKIYTLLLNQSHANMSKMHQYNWWGDIALGCFNLSDMKLLWTKTYKEANHVAETDARKMSNAKLVLQDGAIYIVSNTGHVIKTDSRDGQLDWIHFFRPHYNNQAHYNNPSDWSLGSAPIVTKDKVVCFSKLSGRVFALDKATGRRVWSLTHLRNHEVLGLVDDLVITTTANSLHGIDLKSGKLCWARQILPHNQWNKKWSSGFQLPRAQLIDSSIYCATKNELYRFDGRNGLRLESRSWKMGNETPMTFHIAGKNLYVLSDQVMRDPRRDKQLIDYNTAVHPAGAWRENQITEFKSKNGNHYFYRDGLIFSVKGKKINWSRFVPKAYKWFRNGGKNLAQRGNNEVYISWSGTTSVHDINTGKLLRINSIKIGE